MEWASRQKQSRFKNHVVDKTQSFIGLHAQVLQGNQSLIGMQGRIIEDTKNSFIFEVNDTTKTVLKKGTVFMINDQIVKGDNVAKRLTERIKLRRKHHGK